MVVAAADQLSISGVTIPWRSGAARECGGRPREISEHDNNHGAYVSQVAHATNANLGAGYIVEADAELDKQAAADSEIGKK